MINEVFKTDCIIIGAGVIGLAIAEKLSKHYDTLVVEKNNKFGEETSSRNSEVIHSGIYYPIQSKKTEWCIEGRKKLYSYCGSYQIPYKKCGKYLVATNKSESEYLEKKKMHCKEVGVPYVQISNAEIKKDLDYLKADDALFFPESGIVDSHSFMLSLESKALQGKCSVLYRHGIQSIQKVQDGWQLEIEAEGEKSEVRADFVVNAAGLNAALISNQALKTDKYEHRYCRGRYFSVSGSHPFKNLIYPVPPKDGLGIHVTLDLSGGLRLGPDVDWSKDPSYDCNWDGLAQPFSTATKRYWPHLNDKNLNPGLIGIRPKLFVEGTAYPDFLVENHQGFIHCLGIESPGLTSALSIAENVLDLIKGNSI